MQQLWNVSLRKRVAAIDYGRARIGIALSDEGQRLASPATTLEVSPKQAVAQVVAWLKQYDLAAVVVGIPLEKSGRAGPMAQEVERFIEALAPLISCPIIRRDERFTSAASEKLLQEAGWNRKQRSQRSDTAAAVMLLQEFLDSKLTA
jgi:putative Holliday junction resolvase